MRNILLAGATLVALALGGGGASAANRDIGSSPYRATEPQSGDLQKLPQKPNAAIQEGRAAAVAHMPGVKPKTTPRPATDDLDPDRL